MNVENVCSILRITSKLEHWKDAKILRKKCATFISKHLNEVMQTEGFKAHMTHESLCEILTEMGEFVTQLSSISTQPLKKDRIKISGVKRKRSEM